MTKTITRLFDDLNDARSAVAELAAIGIARSDISIVALDCDTVRATDRAPTGREIHGLDDRSEGPAAGGVATLHDAGKDAGTGAKLGGVVGGGAGLLAGLGLLTLPGVGPVLAGGWLLSTIAGAAVGTAAGGAAGSLVGSLIQAGVSEEDAHVYSEGVRRGGTLVGVRIDDDRFAGARTVMQRHGGVDATARRTAHRAGGWNAPAADTSHGGQAARAASGEPGSDDPAPLSHLPHIPVLSDD